MARSMLHLSVRSYNDSIVHVSCTPPKREVNIGEDEKKIVCASSSKVSQVYEWRIFSQIK